MTTVPVSAALPPAFWRYWTGLTGAALGDSVVSVALPFLALSAGEGAGAVGLVVLFGSLPRFLAPLLGGLADRLPPRGLLALSAGLRALAVGVAGAAALTGALPLAGLAALAFLNGLLSTLAYTAGAALVPRLVPAGLLARANSLSSGALMGVPLVGYGVGGGLVHLVGAGGTLLVGTLPILGLAAAALALPRLPGAAAGERVRPVQDALDGLRVIRRSPLLLALLGMSFALNLAMNVMNVRAPVHLSTLGRGAPDYAVFEALIAGGVLVGIALVTPLAARRSLDTLIGAGRWVLVLGTLGFVPTGVPVWWASAAVFGLGLGLLEVAATTRSQQLVSQEVRGRVVGALMGVNALGLTLGAALAARPLPTPALMLGLAALLAGLALVWPLARRA